MIFDDEEAISLPVKFFGHVVYEKRCPFCEGQFVEADYIDWPYSVLDYTKGGR